MNKLKKALALILALTVICALPITASAAPVDEATIDTSRTGNLDLYKYDLTSAEKDGIWDSSYVSTGVKDETAWRPCSATPSASPRSTPTATLTATP